ncbi:tetraprenyl-beta-curcumene synthase family protein [Fervidibacillus halotolerans]|uniref:Tetraprenyl-beta-curcumene synthase family protein n=1 Tax=Fervidibacillus halotolerans TaxID=2980027 RepID=A0A9E8RXI0_9BACI|nr:tetraprenyl-beta-curcumene synthase family protein [Fervidibacillus halotolerans]WAA11776.1 tetraprenyl-beta-curcumene synthase family protein [Fervidibacillus halotolerans]
MRNVPTRAISLMIRAYKDIFPMVHKELNYWKKRAREIPDPELRKQALSSIETKTFHCEGGAIYAILAKSDYKKVIPFIVAYQTISDYLDNLCDRSTSLDPLDFSALHESMRHALTVGAKHTDYYRYRNEKNDGGYLAELVEVCQRVLKQVPHYPIIHGSLLNLCDYYCQLQIHKHVHPNDRERRLQQWFSEHKEQFPELKWYEFSASAGSTLGIFCLVSYGMREEFHHEDHTAILKGYFPYIQGLHILLDYFIDQEEDRLEGDLNFCFYYNDLKTLGRRMVMFIQKADEYTKGLPDEKFHRLINRGLLGLYLSDEKVKMDKQIDGIVKQLLQSGGLKSKFFYMNAKLYRKWQQVFQ